MTTGPAAQCRQMLSTLQSRVGQQDAIGQHLVDAARQRIARVVTPILTGRGQRAAEANQRARSGRIELAREAGGNLVERIPA
jgi:hypothetical protein